MSPEGRCPHFPFERDRERPLDPPPQFGELRRNQPVAKVTLWDGNQVWLITRHEDVVAVLGDVRFSSVTSSPGYPLLSPGVAASRRQDETFLRMDRPKHTEHRAMWMPSFSAKRVLELRPAIQKIVDDSLDAMLAKGPPADLVEDFALVVPSLVICSLLDVPYSDHGFFQKHTKTRTTHTSAPEKVHAAVQALKDYWARLIDEREKKPGDDLISQLLVNQVAAGRLTKEELVGMAQLMLLAGHETTANMIALGTLTLLQHPDQLAAIKRDPALTPMAVEELLRFLSIAQNGLGRACIEDAEVGGQLIRKGEGVLVLIAAANRDEGAFANADDFDIRRGARRHVAFGANIHQCIGQPLARAELQIVFDTLYRRVPALRIAVPERDIPYKYDSLFFGVESLPVEW